ncbi:hypothetical protein TNCV_908041 [Trichonephila clavipes]|nr:hypothetical protein TNCV_908041 [Trichonephila clavipes]
MIDCIDEKFTFKCTYSDLFYITNKIVYRPSKYGLETGHAAEMTPSPCLGTDFTSAAHKFLTGTTLVRHFLSFGQLSCNSS